MNPYETKRYLNEYLLFHYGRRNELCAFSILPVEFFRFHERIREECLSPLPKSGKNAGPIRALDVGCAVGRFTFELARVAHEVVGIDNAKSLIRAAQGIAVKCSATARIQESGNEFQTVRLGLPKGTRPERVSFEVGDAQKLHRFARKPFDIVACINLLCRLPRPSAFLSQLPGLVRQGGQLVIASPFSWLPEYTPTREWLTATDLEERLEPSFRMVRTRDLPFVIREHRRKYQLVVSHVMTFVRRS